MAFLVDTHAHLYADQFKSDRNEMMQRAIDKGIQHIFLPNIDETSIPGMMDLEAQFPDLCHAMMGLHPCSVKENYKDILSMMEEWFHKRPFCAVGEIGLDYYWSKDFIENQKDAFRVQCRWAKELDIPVVIHARDSLDDIIDIVTEEKTENFRGIFHCFGGSLEQAEKIIDLGFMMGLGGVLTFKKANLGAVIQHIDMKHLVLETDAPYLSPAPFRGKRNESAYVHIVAQKLAGIKGLSIDQVAEITSKNALGLFGVD
jgi:TatD DNase family protein